MSKLDADADPGVAALRPFVPARDFATSFRFYVDLGFEPSRIGDGLASMGLGAFAFLLQDHYVEDWANNFMMHLLVRDLDGWWARIRGLDLAGRYGVKSPAEPKLQPWGLTVAYVWDTSGVLWHFARAPD